MVVKETERDRLREVRTNGKAEEIEMDGGKERVQRVRETD